MKTIRGLILSMFIISIFGCTATQPEDPVSEINLLRGSITTCGSGDFGDVDFAISCDPGVRETFELAISLLHSFEYDQAEKAFVNVLDIDRDCAMAYWGVAMANFHSLWFQSGNDYLIKGSKILEASNSIEKTERERDYIDAIAGFYNNWETDSREVRIARFEQNMKLVYEKYSQDKEAAIFYALALRASSDPTDRSYKKQRESGKILESIYPDQPNHPGIAHYIIHNYDYPELAELALPAARSYAEIAPSSAHAQHMPSHIFTRLGLWEESINSNLKVISSALCYTESLDSTAHWDEELHGIDYLVYAYLQTGQNDKAIDQLEYLKSFKRVFPVNFKVYYTAAAVPARIALENRDWEHAANLRLPDIDMDWKDFPWQRSILHFARALGAIHLGDLQSANTELDILRSNRQELIDIDDEYKANQVNIQIKTIQAWISYAEGDGDSAEKLMKEAMDMEYRTSKHPVTPGEVLPAGELYGDLLLSLDKPEEALKIYQNDLIQHPNRFNGIYGAATAAQRSGDLKLAKQYYHQLIELAGNSERVEVKTARQNLEDARDDA